MARQVLENGVILPAEYSDDWYDDMTSNLTKLDDVIGSDSEKLSSTDVGAAALSNNYNDLDNLPTIPTVNDATLTIQKNGVDVQTFTANASSNVTANITVPTKTSDLTNDSDFVDISNPAVSSGITSAKVTDYDTHIADTDIHVTTADKATWNTVTSAKVTDYDTHIADTDIHVTTADKATWNTVTSKADDSDVVHVTGDETVAGNKNFQGLLTTTPSESLWPTGLNTTDDITYLGREVIHLEYKSSGQLTDLSGGAWDVAALGAGCFFFRINNGKDIRYKNLATGDVNRIPVVSGTNRFINDVTPNQDNTYGLGSSSLRWRTINGLNPGSLGMPDLNNGIDISSYLTNAGTVTPSEYTPSVNGYICVQISADSPPVIRMYNDYGFDNTVYTERNEIGSTSGGTYTRFASLIFPANKDVKVYIIIFIIVI